MPRKYELPDFLIGILDQKSYDKWLHKKASAHAGRDKKRGNITVTRESYKISMHKAVVRSEGRDEYTGERLDWLLAGKYHNTESKNGKRVYKAKHAHKPTIDHVGDGLGEADFKICAWHVNDAKSDLSYADFVELCRKVISHFERQKNI